MAPAHAQTSNCRLSGNSPAPTNGRNGFVPLAICVSGLNGGNLVGSAGELIIANSERDRLAIKDAADGNATPNGCKIQYRSRKGTTGRASAHKHRAGIKGQSFGATHEERQREANRRDDARQARSGAAVEMRRCNKPTLAQLAACVNSAAPFLPGGPTPCTTYMLNRCSLSALRRDDEGLRPQYFIADHGSPRQYLGQARKTLGPRAPSCSAYPPLSLVMREARLN
jgi:hypothetical protein